VASIGSTIIWQQKYGGDNCDLKKHVYNEIFNIVPLTSAICVYVHTVTWRLVAGTVDPVWTAIARQGSVNTWEARQEPPQSNV
jgi:hypothetical protein